MVFSRGGESGRSSVASKVAIAVFSLSLGGLLLFLSVPRLIAEILMLPGNRVLAMIQKRTVPSDRDLEILTACRQRSLSWSDSAQPRTDLAWAQLLSTRKVAGGGPDYHRQVTAAIQSLRDGRARAGKPLRLDEARLRVGERGRTRATHCAASRDGDPHGSKEAETYGFPHVLRNILFASDAFSITLVVTRANKKGSFSGEEVRT
jgi:hypothetical protein